MSDLVIDGSVAIKWVIEEEGTPQALALRCQAVVAPDLLVAECANILWKKVRRNELSEQEAAFAAGLLARADIELVAMRPYLETAVGPAVRGRRSRSRVRDAAWALRLLARTTARRCYKPRARASPRRQDVCRSRRSGQRC